MKNTLLITATLAALTLVGCKDETISGFADRKAVWKLLEIDRKPFDADATISFPKPGLINGQAPCNTYSSEQKAPYPWFEIGPIAATRMACEDMDAESNYFTALTQMRQVETSGDMLIMSNEAGRQMVFLAQR
ncbi:META domain-containing protein [Aliiroseovarius sp. S1339]|uniref:META domain-containing protein n=1 Tax=Aliiroseovarius sp. S1339 TaxID=2936990 RepID=UPI0020BD7639|nr:META domain-containing protein [Aliiroseovarius sp. S1339]MCK8463904.1 META domain-containing protein [Aliiroseovarius sp. S1339]